MSAIGPEGMGVGICLPLFGSEQVKRETYME